MLKLLKQEELNKSIWSSFTNDFLHRSVGSSIFLREKLFWHRFIQRLHVTTMNLHLEIFINYIKIVENWSELLKIVGKNNIVSIAELY